MPIPSEAQSCGDVVDFERQKTDPPNPPFDFYSVHFSASLRVFIPNDISNFLRDKTLRRWAFNSFGNIGLTTAIFSSS